MEDQPYDFIDGDAPEKRETNRKMAKAAKEGELFSNSKKAEDIPTRGRKGGNFSRHEEVEEGRSSNNNSSSNSGRSDRDKTSRETSDNPAGSDSPFLVRVVDKLFKLFE